MPPVSNKTINSNSVGLGLVYAWSRPGFVYFSSLVCLRKMQPNYFYNVCCERDICSIFVVSALVKLLRLERIFKSLLEITSSSMKTAYLSHIFTNVQFLNETKNRKISFSSEQNTVFKMFFFSCLPFDLSAASSHFSSISTFLFSFYYSLPINVTIKAIFSLHPYFMNNILKQF